MAEGNTPEVSQLTAGLDRFDSTQWGLAHMLMEPAQATRVDEEARVCCYLDIACLPVWLSNWICLNKSSPVLICR